MARLDNEVTDKHSSKAVAKTDLKALTTQAIMSRAPAIINKILDFTEKYIASEDEVKRKEANVFGLKILDKTLPKEVKVSHHHEGYIKDSLADMFVRMSGNNITKAEAVEMEEAIIVEDDDE